MLIRSLLRHSLSNQLGRGQKKTPPVTGRRSNYAHLTDINLQALCHRNVKRVHSVFTGGSADSSLIPQAGRKIQTSAGRNGLQINSQLIRVSKHSIVSHRSPASESGIFLLSELLKMGKKKRHPFRGGGPTMLISLTSIYKTSVIETLKEFTASLQGEAPIPASFHKRLVRYIHQLDTTVCKLNPVDTSE